MMISRRTALKASLSAGVLASVAPGLAFANVDTDRRLLFIFLRGGMDGLSAVQPYGDPLFRELRGVLADPEPDSGAEHATHKIDGLFALNPDLAGLHGLLKENQALAVHALASPYRERSHFDAQDVMENGAATKAERSGWLNRAVGVMPAAFAAGRSDVALGLGATLPLILRGPQSVGGWSPPTLPGVDEDTLMRIGDLYAQHPVLGEAFAKARSAAAMAGGMDMDDMDGGQGSGNAAFFTEMATVAAQFLKAADGPRIATIDYGNWDSHASQNERLDAPPDRFQGRFVELYKGLDRGIGTIRDELGPEIWAKTVVMCVTEFGRTVRINGTLGTDHGTAGAMFLVGGAVNGGRVVTDWPGLRPQDLHEDRDLKPTLDHRQVFKGVLAEHFAIAEGALEDTVFPGTRALTPVEGLIRT